MKVVALVSYRYDEDYLEDLKKNLGGLVDEVIVRFDEKGDFWKDEGKYRRQMVRQAEEAGADYALVIDPDERLEKRAASRLRKMMRKNLGRKVLFNFHFRELYTPNRYRVDGIWDKKERVMVFPVRADNVFSKAKLHTPRQPMNDDYEWIQTGLNVYHLKHIKPELRKSRKEIYKKLDPDERWNGGVGYDYLDDETDVELAKIPSWRMYKPKYRDYKINKGIFKI